MDGVCLRLLLAVALAAPAAGLLAGLAAHGSRRCGDAGPPADLAARGLDCDPEIPRYRMDQWMSEHGGTAPDHPAVFVGTHTHEAKVFPDMEAFLAQYGSEEVVALPEYAQSGGAFKNPKAKGRVTASFRKLSESWNDTFVYYSDFKCYEGSLCVKAAKQFGKPKLFDVKQQQSKNFLVGGPDSGLPFHKHQKTWQGLAMGRKAWYVLPPGSMSEALHDATGPYIFPVRSYHGAMQQQKLGRRPFYCTQHAGEVFYIPDYWWHATRNLDRYQVAYGEKPKQPQQEGSPELAKAMSFFPTQAFDTAGFTNSHGSGPEGDTSPMPYTIMGRDTHLHRTCSWGEFDGAEYGLDEPLRRVRAMAGSSQMQCGLAETAAFAHCAIADNLVVLAWSCSDRLQPEHVQELNRRAHSYKAMAWELSNALAERENFICRLD